MSGSPDVWSRVESFIRHHMEDGHELDQQLLADFMKIRRDAASCREELRGRDEELLRVRTTQAAAAHALDNLCIEFGIGHGLQPMEAADKLRQTIQGGR